MIYYVSIGRISDKVLLATSKTSNKVSNSKDQEVREHCMQLLSRQSQSVSTQKCEQLGFAWHIYQDRNLISYILVSDVGLPDEYAMTFLR